MYKWTAPEHWTDDWLLKQAKRLRTSTLRRKIVGTYVSLGMSVQVDQRKACLEALGIVVGNVKPCTELEHFETKRLKERLGITSYSTTTRRNGVEVYTNWFVTIVNLVADTTNRTTLIKYYQHFVKADGGDSSFYDYEQRLKRDGFLEYWESYCESLRNR